MIGQTGDISVIGNRNQITATGGDVKVTDEKAVITAEQFGEDGLMLQKGKKGFRRLILK